MKYVICDNKTNALYSFTQDDGTMFYEFNSKEDAQLFINYFGIKNNKVSECYGLEIVHDCYGCFVRVVDKMKIKIIKGEK